MMRALTKKVPILIEILECLKKHGQRLDSEIALETGVPIATVRRRVAMLAGTGVIVTCKVTRFEDGKALDDAVVCRMSGYFPPPAPGRKAKAPAPVEREVLPR
jgi:transcription initiation factor IIE alpha subunit